PKAALLNPRPNHYPAGTSTAAIHIHSASREMDLGESSEFAPVFKLFDPEEYLREISVQYLTSSEERTLASAAPRLLRDILEFRKSNIALSSAICQFDKKIKQDTCSLVTLNYASRAMADQGFVPILDCFNHNDVGGSGIASTADKLFLEARKDYLAGEQLYVTYGVLDLFKHAINYNYFDPKGAHFIPLERFILPISKERATHLVANKTKNCRVFATPRPEFSQIAQPNAYFSTDGASKSMIKILTLLCGDKTNAKRLANDLLTQIDNQNEIHKHSKKEFKGRLMRFYNALHKEKQIIAGSRAWLEKHF
ncbi:hypothetical protein, partial [Oleiphilus sp. HI0080]